MLKDFIKQVLGSTVVRFLAQVRDGMIAKSLKAYGIVVRHQYTNLVIDNHAINELNFSESRNLPREKPHIIFVTEKWCDCNPKMGMTNSEHNLFGSLESSQFTTYERFHFDEYYYQHHAADIALLERCTIAKPDLLVLTWWHGKVSIFKPFNPNLETLRIISEEMHIPIVAIWFDSIFSKVMAISESILPYTKLNVVLDSSIAYLSKTKHPEKYVPFWTPQDSRIFYNPNLPRDIQVSFLGSTKGYVDRLAGITALQNNGIEVYQAGGQREKQIPVNEYANVFMRSQIALNFSRARSSNIAQAKGRIFEVTLCGALLMESENPETAKWFEPMIDYVSFKDESDLLEKVQYYLIHEQERLAIAERGHRRAMANYTGELFWHSLLDKIKVLTRD